MTGEPWRPDTPPIRSIPEEQRAEIICAAFLDGRIRLDEAVTWCYLAGVPLPAAIGDALFTAFVGYRHGATKDLAEAFGIAEPYALRKARGKPPLDRETARRVVDTFKAAGYSLSPPETNDNTAFHAAATWLGVSPATVARSYYSKA